jgi:hypothetical protein
MVLQTLDAPNVDRVVEPFYAENVDSDSTLI